jgi:hypothetical protein
MLGVPANALTALATSGRSPVQPFDLLSPLSNMKTYLGSLAADTAASLIKGIEELGREEPGIRRFAQVLGILITLIRLHTKAASFTPAAADEFASEAGACAQFFRQIEAAPLFHLSLSLLARVLVTDPRPDAARIQRGMRTARYLLSLEDKIERLRTEEAMLSFLLAANRIAALSATHDAVERSEWLISSLRSQPVLIARLIARMIGIRLGGKDAPDRAMLLEHLNRSDMMTYMLDSSLGGAADSSFPGSQPGQTTEGHLSIDAMLAVIASCPPELWLDQVAGAPQPAENEYWGADHAPHLLLRMYAAEASVDAQSELLGIDYAKQRKISKLRISQIDYPRARPHGLLLHSFRSMRRLWVENAFQPDDPEVWPLVSEPTLLTLECALNRALGLKFVFSAVGGGYDMLGMAPNERECWSGAG